MDWSKIKYFEPHEFKCRYSHRSDMNQEFMEALDELRERYGKPLHPTSGFRDRRKHPIEARKKSPGAHSLGLAVDFRIERGEAYRLLEIVMEMGVFTGIGINQKGGGRFIHLDMATSKQLKGAPRPTIWSY